MAKVLNKETYYYPVTLELSAEEAEFLLRLFGHHVKGGKSYHIYEALSDEFGKDVEPYSVKFSNDLLQVEV